MGNVIKADPTRNEIIVSGRSRSDPPQRVLITNQTVLVKQVKGSVADLKVGDTIEVTGIPLQIDARMIRVGEIPSRQPAPPTRPVSPGAAERLSRQPRQPLSRSRLQGRVLRVSPLTVQLAEGLNADLKVTGETTIMRAEKVALGSVKPGDPIYALGSRDQSGALVARRVQVGLEGFPGANLRSAARPRPTKPVRKKP